MIYSKQIDDIDIEIYNRLEASEIPEKKWNELGRTTLYTNPFYERWNLLPALNHLEKSKAVYLVTVIKQGDLIGLFPVIINKHRLGLKTLSLWKHDHCYLTDPLMKVNIDLVKVLCCVGKSFRTHWSQVDLHSPKLFMGCSKKNINSAYYSRAAILHPANIPNKLLNLPKKLQQDIKRTYHNLESKHCIKYSKQSSLIDSFERYRELEHKGWKGRAKGSINSSQDTLGYYYDMIKDHSSHHKISFQELLADNISIAMSMRFISKGKMYEVKTSYDESYKKFNPGKLLEVINLDNLATDNFELVDSCTGENNKLINKLWPDRICLNSSYIFYPTLVSQVLQIIHTSKKMKQKFKVFNHAYN